MLRERTALKKHVVSFLRLKKCMAAHMHIAGLFTGRLYCATVWIVKNWGGMKIVCTLY